ncbi:MAG: MFS transporter [Anaerolineae bacterium]|nr:MFS transporter [Anaerolineae bacterium]
MATQHPATTVPTKPRLDVKQTLLIGLGLFGLNMMWKLYNDYVPIFLQAGNSLFDAGLAVKTTGFGLGAALTGLIMTLDNAAGLLLMPVIGLWSDRVWVRRLGRRKPFIVTLAPISILTFVLIPVIVKGTPVALSGQTAQLGRELTWLMISIGLFILTMAGFRNPVFSLLPDLTPSPLRSQGNSIINLMGGLSGVIITFVGAALYRQDIAWPFFFGGAMMGLAVLVLALAIKEPRYLTDAPEVREEGAGLGALRELKKISPEVRPSLIRLVLAIFLWFVGFNAIETFLTSYCVNVLGVQENQASLLSGIPYATFIAFAVPAGLIAARFGRKRSIITGLWLFAGLLLVGFFLPNLTVTIIVLVLVGVVWALININSLPMVVDTALDDTTTGTFIGIYFIGSQTAAVVGPLLNGAVIEASQNYGMVMLMPVVFFVLAALAMRGVTRGEARG